MPSDCAGATEFEAICNDRIKPGSLNCSLVVGPLLWADKRTKKGGRKADPKNERKKCPTTVVGPFLRSFFGAAFRPPPFFGHVWQRKVGPHQTTLLQERAVEYPVLHCQSMPICLQICTNPSIKHARKECTPDLPPGPFSCTHYN